MRDLGARLVEVLCARLVEAREKRFGEAGGCGERGDLGARLVEAREELV